MKRTKWFTTQDWFLMEGDVLACLRRLPSQFVHCAVTSPPYWCIRNYGMDGQIGMEPTPQEYVERLVTVFRELRRVLRKDGTLWLNLGDTYAGSGHGWNKGTGKVPQKKRPHIEAGQGVPLSHKFKLHGYPKKSLIGIPWLVAFALQNDGWILRSDIVWSKNNTMPESVKDRPTRTHEFIFLLTKTPNYYYDYEAAMEPAVHPNDNRQKRCKPDHKSTTYGMPARTDRKQDNVGKSNYTGFNDRYRDSLPERDTSKRRLRDVWRISTVGFPGTHFATFPPALVEKPILAGSPEGGIILDPFCGSGATGMMAIKLKRKFIGIDLKPEYIEMSRKRITQALDIQK